MKTVKMVLLVALFPTLGMAESGAQCERKPENTCKPIRHVAKPTVQKVSLPRENIFIINNNTNTNSNGSLEKPRARRVTVEKSAYSDRDDKKNSISALVVRSATGLQVSQTTSTTFEARTTQQLDVGAMYQRDIGNVLRFSVGGTIGGTVMGGVGFKF